MLGRAFPVFEAPNAFRARCAAGYREFNTARGLPAGAWVPAPERARIRTALARTMFAETHGRAPADARELSGFLARASRPASMAVAGYDLTFSPVKSETGFVGARAGVVRIRRCPAAWPCRSS